MGTIAQYAFSISLFIAIPVTVQWAVGKLSARRAARISTDLAPAPVAQSSHE
jgi:hypothetical protein